jgi:hypothetical protein
MKPAARDGPVRRGSVFSGHRLPEERGNVIAEADGRRLALAAALLALRFRAPLRPWGLARLNSFR